MGGGKFNPETGPAFGVGLEIDLAPHAFDGALDNRQANAGTIVLFVAVDTSEDLKDAVAMLWRGADAIVLYAKAHAILPGSGPDLDLRFSAALDEFDRVAEEVGDALCEECRVAEHRQERVADFNVRPRGLKLRVLFQDIADEPGQVDGLGSEFGTRDSGVGQHVEDEPI